MTKKHTMDAVRDWLLRQPAGSIWTPTSASLACSKDGIKASSGATCGVLMEMVREELVLKIEHSLGIDAPRGAYKILERPAPAPVAHDRVPVGSAIVTPLLSADQQMALPPAAKQALSAIQKIQEGLDELQLAIIACFSPTTGTATDLKKAVGQE